MSRPPSSPSIEDAPRTGGRDVRRIIENPWAAAATGIVIAALLGAFWLIAAGADPLGAVSYLLRIVHVLAAMVWVGLIVFVNFVQLKAIQDVDDAGRAAILNVIAPRVAWWYRHASTVVVASGALLLVTTGYAFEAWVFGASVYIPPLRSLMLWIGIILALAMWMFVHMYIWPALQVVIGLRPGGAGAVTAARERVRLFARWNLILVIPVTFVMVAAPHLY